MSKIFFVIFLLIGCVDSPTVDDVRWVEDKIDEPRWVRTGECRKSTRIEKTGKPLYTDIEKTFWQCQEVYQPFYPKSR